MSLRRNSLAHKVMCYDVVSATRNQIKYAKHRADDPELVARLERKLEEWLKKREPKYQRAVLSTPSF